MLFVLKVLLFFYLSSEVVNASIFSWLYQLSSDEKSFAVAAINNKRNNHKRTPPLQWSKTIANEVADKLSYWKCRNTDDVPSDKYGYTVYYGSGGLREAINGWYAELEHYDFKHPEFSKLNRNFVQVASKNIQQIGCGERTCGSTNVYLCGFDKPNTYNAFLNDSIEPLLVDISTAILTDIQYSTETQIISQISTDYQTLLTVNTNTIFLTQLSTDYQTHNFTDINTVTNTQLSTITHIQNVTNTDVVTQVQTSVDTKTQNITATKILTDVRITTATETEYIINTDTVTLTNVLTSVRNNTLTEFHTLTETQTKRDTETDSVTIFSTITEVSTLSVTRENPVTVSENITVTHLKTNVETLNITVQSPITHTVHLTDRQIVIYTNNVTLTEVDIRSHTSYITTYEIITETLPIEIDFTETLTETNTLKYTHTESITETEQEIVYVTNTIKAISTVIETTTDKESITETEIHTQNITVTQPITRTINLTRTETTILTDLIIHTETDIRNQTLLVTTYNIQTEMVPISLVSTETLFQINTDTYTLTQTQTQTDILTFTKMTTQTTVETSHITSTVLLPFTETEFKTKTEKDVHNITLVEPITHTIDFTKTETVINTEYMTFTEIDTFNHTSLLTTFEVVTETFPISIFYTETFTTTNKLEYTFTKIITEKQTELIYETNSVIETSIVPITITETMEITKHDTYIHNTTITEPITHTIHSLITETVLTVKNVTVTESEISSTTSERTMYETTTVTLPVSVLYTETVTESNMDLVTITQNGYSGTTTETVTVTVHDEYLTLESSSGRVNSAVSSENIDALGRSTNSKDIVSQYSSIESESILSSTVPNDSLYVDKSSKNIHINTQLSSLSTTTTHSPIEERLATDDEDEIIDGGRIITKQTAQTVKNVKSSSLVPSTVLSSDDIVSYSTYTGSSVLNSVESSLDAAFNTPNLENTKQTSSTKLSSISYDLDGVAVSMFTEREPSGSFGAHSAKNTLTGTNTLISLTGASKSVIFDGTSGLDPLVDSSNSETTDQFNKPSHFQSPIVPTSSNAVISLSSDGSVVYAYTDSNSKGGIALQTGVSSIHQTPGSSEDLIDSTAVIQLEHKRTDKIEYTKMDELYSMSKMSNVTMTTGQNTYTGQRTDENGNTIVSKTSSNNQYRKNISFTADEDLTKSLGGPYTDLNTQIKSKLMVSDIRTSSDDDSRTTTHMIASTMSNSQATVTTTAFIVSNNAVKKSQVGFLKFMVSVLLTATVLLI